ncbi:MAG: RNA polymerase factor sigma-54 [Bacteroidales bacterium]|nr:RNA polymerase factor sigma-54 [Bacteroidales bacterium]
MLKQRLQQKLLQKLSPQQIQIIKLLEIPTVQLEQRIKKELEENPVLEEGYDDQEENYTAQEEDTDTGEQNTEEETTHQDEQDEFSLDDYMDDDEIPDYRLSLKNFSQDEKREEIPFSVGSTFHDYLYSQAGLQNFNEKERLLADYIIGNIGEDGYLRRDIENIVDDLAFTQNITASEEELLNILKVIQEFDPPGVGARNLQECLLLQIERKDTTEPSIALAHKILKHYFTEFTRKHYDKILEKLNITEEDLKKAIDEILKLNPKPGSSFSDPMNKPVQHIVPDFILEINEGDIQLSLNARNVPDLRINKQYAEMMKAYHENQKKHTREEKDAISFVKQKLDSAKWFIDAIKQRQNTLMLTMQAIVDFQKQFFLTGDETKLRPMILKDIAEITGLDISTISRVANSKYVQTPYGIYQLKYFFSEGLQTDSGEEVSTREIKTILQEMIAKEDKRKPLTDEKLTAVLQKKGYQIARRTVAKYREQLNIPVARLRKEL